MHLSGKDVEEKNQWGRKSIQLTLGEADINFINLYWSKCWKLKKNPFPNAWKISIGHSFRIPKFKFWQPGTISKRFNQSSQ